MFERCAMRRAHDTASVFIVVCTLSTCALNDFGVLARQNQVTDVT